MSGGRKTKMKFKIVLTTGESWVIDRTAKTNFADFCTELVKNEFYISITEGTPDLMINRNHIIYVTEVS